METSEDYLLVQELVPHIAKNIKAFWGSEFLPEYITKLMFDTRDGKRQGFPDGVGKSLTNLLNRHDEEFPRVVKYNVWDNV